MYTQLELLNQKWDGILQTIRQDNGLSDVAFKTWLLPLKIFRIDDNVLKITAPFDQAVTYIENKYKTFLYVAVAEAMGTEYEIRIMTEEEAEKEKKAAPQPKSAPGPAAKQTDSKNTNLNPKYTFETFVIGSNNRFAHAASVAVAESPGKEYNPLFLYGGVGLGKTHLMHSVAHYILQRDASARVLYVTSEVFTNELIDSIRNGNNTSMTKFREKYRNIDVLLIDDIQFIIGKESTQEEFFHTFNALHGANKQIIVSSDRPPKDLETLEARLQSRFEWGLLADISMPDYEMRLAILKKKTELEGILIDDDILALIATRIDSNIRELEGVLNKILAYTSLTHSPITIEVVEKAINDVTLQKENIISADYIQDVVSNYFKIDKRDLVSSKKSNDIAYPRQIAMYLCRTVGQMSFPRIGNDFGGRDHTTVMHAYKKIEKEIKENTNTKLIVESVKTIITNKK